VDLWGRLSNPPETVKSLTGQGSRASVRSRKTAEGTPSQRSQRVAEAPPEEKGRLSNPAARSGCRVGDTPDISEGQLLPKPVRRSVQRRLDEAEIDQLVAGYRTGRSLADLAEALGIHRRTVAAHLEARGIPRRTNKPKMTAADTHEAARRHHAGESLPTIARSLGSLAVDPSTVRRLLKRPPSVQNP
jgi:hypothetical protein